MKVLHLITALETGGAETMLVKLLRGMDRERCEQGVVSMVPPGPRGRDVIEAGAELHHLDMRRGVPSPAGLHRLVALLRRQRPDVVQTWLYHADLLGLAAVRLGFPLGGRPALAWNLRCAFMDFSSYRRSTRWTVSLCARLSGLPEAVAANSRPAVDQHIGLGYAPRRFEVIPNGFDAGVFRPRPEMPAQLREQLGVPREALLVGMAARFDAMKDHRGFLRAAGLVAARLPQVYFVLCGQGVEPGNARLERWARQARLGGRLHLLGQYERMPELMAGLDVCVSSSLGESFPNVLGEALCSGVPCVATDAGESASIVGSAGEVVPTGDPEALAGAMFRLLSRPAQERTRLGREGRMRMVREYSMQAVAARYAEFYESLIRPAARC